jgi:hypothetical protein
VKIALILLFISAACSSSEERTRQAAEHRQSLVSLRATEVVRALQPQTSVGRLVYDQPVDLAGDSTLQNRR